MIDRDTMIHLVAGGSGGTMGAIVTCPLEVVKTRLQSSVATFNNGGGGGSVHIPVEASINGTGWTTCRSVHGSKQQLRTVCARNVVRRAPEIVVPHSLVHGTSPAPTGSIGLIKCLKYIVEREGPSALFKGLAPNLIGVAPTRAIYFCTYNSAKEWFNGSHRLVTESPIVHILAALCAGFTSTTLTNPIWVIKTRLQLDQTRPVGKQRYTASACIRDVLKVHGLAGFYKGVTASYWGTSETVIHWVVYEKLKKIISARHHYEGEASDDKVPEEFLEYMAAAAVSRTCAAFLTYPHEVARTRMRQGTPRYRSFWPTLSLVFHEEGFRALYRGLCTQLVRQIPNSAIMLSTYEAVVYGLTRYYAEETEFYEAPDVVETGWEDKKNHG